MSSPVVTPNIGLQIPAFNTPNWQVPTNYNWNLLDLILGGSLAVPGLSATNVTVANVGAMLAPGFVAETPAGAIPGTVYTLSHTPGLLLAFFVNGVFKRPVLDYTLTGAAVTLGTATSGGNTVYALYFK